MANMLPMNERQAIMQEPCRGCMYFSGWNCDYILMEKKRRPSPPGEACTARKTRDISRRERMAMIGAELKEIAPKVVPSLANKPRTAQVQNARPVFRSKEPAKKTVFNQTKKPPKPKRKKEPKAPVRQTFAQICERLNTSEVIGLYESAKSDREIAQVVGCSATTVRNWRNATGRPPLAQRGKSSPLEPHLESIKSALAAGMSDYSLAKTYGTAPQSIARLRKKHDLGPAQGKKGTEEHGNEG